MGKVFEFWLHVRKGLAADGEDVDGRESSVSFLAGRLYFLQWEGN